MAQSLPGALVNVSYMFDNFFFSSLNTSFSSTDTVYWFSLAMCMSSFRCYKCMSDDMKLKEVYVMVLDLIG